MGEEWGGGGGRGPRPNRILRGNLSPSDSDGLRFLLRFVGATFLQAEPGTLPHGAHGQGQGMPVGGLMSGGSLVDPWWIRSGSVVDPPMNLVDPGASAIPALYVFTHSSGREARPTSSFIKLKGTSTPRGAKPPRYHDTTAPLLEFYQSLVTGSCFLEFYPVQVSSRSLHFDRGRIGPWGGAGAGCKGFWFCGCLRVPCALCMHFCFQGEPLYKEDG